MKGSNWRLWCKKKMTRDNLIVFALLGLLLMVIALPTGKKDEKAAAESELLDTENGKIELGQEEYTDCEAELERKLELFLSRMDGVGQTEVMITFSSTQEQVVEKDPTSALAKTGENDSAGGSRSIESQNLGQETVYTTDREGNRTPYVKKTLAAQVRGVTVLAQGGGEPVIQKNITDVIMALFGIDAHKIKVAKLVTAK